MRMLFAAAAALVLALPAIAAEKNVTLNGDNTKITFVGTKPGGQTRRRVQDPDRDRHGRSGTR